MAIVTLREILKNAQDRQYGVGLFNMFNLEMARGIIAAAEEEQSPVILGLAEVHTSIIPFDYAIYLMRKLAQEAQVPVCLHLDHGVSSDLIRKAIDSGFSSVMYDGSSLSYEDNVSHTCDIVQYAKRQGVSVEAELGHVGGSEDGSSDDETIYTEVGKVPAFIEQTGIDALAVAIGTVHGQYRKTPKLDIDRLKSIAEVAAVPLVLHGGSGLSDDDFKTTIQNGIRKINICTDMCLAAVQTAKRDDICSYEAMVPATMNAVKSVVCNKIRLFGSNQKA